MSNNWPVLVSVLLALAALGTNLWTGRAQAAKLRTEAQKVKVEAAGTEATTGKVGAEEIEIYVEASVGLVRELRTELTATKKELHETQRELQETRALVQELKRKTEEQEQLADVLTRKMEETNARALYWEQQFNRATNAPPKGI